VLAAVVLVVEGRDLLASAVAAICWPLGGHYDVWKGSTPVLVAAQGRLGRADPAQPQE
jgi:hypothetical protein